MAFMLIELYSWFKSKFIITFFPSFIANCLFKAVQLNLYIAAKKKTVLNLNEMNPGPEMPDN